MSTSANNRKGFTIVELLIVIVVIAILVTIAVVAYNGIQQRARNTARVASANKFMKAIGIYATTDGATPLLNAVGSFNSRCVGADNKDMNGDGTKDCYTYNGTVYTSNSSTIDSLLSTTGAYGSASYPTLTAAGAVYTAPSIANYRAQIDGQFGQLQLRFYLEGVDQDCQIPVIYPTADLADGTHTYTAVGHKNSGTISSAFTACVVDLSKYE